MTTVQMKPPPMAWAQRSDRLYIIINAECKDIAYKFTESSIYFKGINVNNSAEVYEVTLNFHGAIKPDEIVVKNLQRYMEFTVTKQQPGPYWPALTKDKSKLHFLKADFNRFKGDSCDEDDDSDYEYNYKYGDMADDDDDDDAQETDDEVEEEEEENEVHDQELLCNDCGDTGVDDLAKNCDGDKETFDKVDGGSDGQQMDKKLNEIAVDTAANTTGNAESNE